MDRWDRKQSWRLTLLVGAVAVCALALFLFGWGADGVGRSMWDPAGVVNEGSARAAEDDARPGAVEAVIAEPPRELVGVQILVTDPAGVPVSGAELRRSTTLDGGDEVVAVTGARGILAFEAGTPAAMVVLHASYLPYPIEEHVELPREIRLDRGHRVSVRAVDDDGRPVPGVEVSVRQAPVAWSANGLQRTGLTDSGGRAQLSGLLAGPFRLTVDAPEHVMVGMTVGASAPTEGVLNMRRPLVALGRSRAPLDSFEGSISSGSATSSLTPMGISQTTLTRFATGLRAARPNIVAFAICPDGAVPDAAHFRVSYLCGGHWGVAKIPFRPYESGMEPIAFGPEDSAVTGTLHQVIVRSRDGMEIPVSDLQLAIVQLEGPDLAHPVRVFKERQQIRLPVGRYRLQSRIPAVLASLAGFEFDVTASDRSERIHDALITLDQHLTVARLRLRGSHAAGGLGGPGVGTIRVSATAVGTAAQFFQPGEVGEVPVCLLEGWNDVTVIDCNSLERRIRTRVTRSGRAALDDTGTLTFEH